jgi:hypothetical protein
MKFCDQLHAILTARGGVVEFAELFAIVETLLKESYRRNSSSFIYPSLVITRWVSDGFLEADLEVGGFRLRRPTLFSCGSGRWTLVGARFAPVKDYLTSNLSVQAATGDEYSTPKIIFRLKAGKPLNVSALNALGCDVYGDERISASQLFAAEAGSLASRIATPVEFPQAYAHLRWFKVSLPEFTVTDVDLVNVGTGHYILRSHGSGRPVTKHIKLLPDKRLVEFADWRWLYVSLMVDSGRAVECFYDPKREIFAVCRITGPFGRQENWLPKELAQSLGSASFSKAITTDRIQDYDGNWKDIVAYPNISRNLALTVYDALGMNRIHPLRFLQY